jgi:uncharacterized phage protein gp47/JayE
MSYEAPAITSAGLIIPSFQDIQNNLIANFQLVYGADVYLGPDSADAQWIGVVSLMLSDAMQGLQLEYNNRASQTAIGAALDSLVKINGLSRLVASYSTCDVLLTGTAGSTIVNGIVTDVNGNNWSLPTPVTIPSGGTLTVTATCQVLGAINAAIGTVTTIGTPTSGWISVTNAAAASPGQPVETDSQLRARQAISTELPSETLLDGTRAAIATLEGVTRSHVYENFTNAEDGNGLLAHSIWAVVEGGVDAAVAQVIQANKGDGCGLNGTTSIAVLDPISGVTETILFSRPAYVPIYVSLVITLLAGGTSASLTAINAAIATYLNSLQIGQTVTLSALYAVAMSVMPSLLTPQFAIESLTLATTPTPTATSDISVLFNQVAQAATVLVSQPS